MCTLEDLKNEILNIEELNKIYKKVKELRKENFDFHCNFFDDLFVIKNSDITFKSLENNYFNTGVFKFIFQHKELNSECAIELTISLKSPYEEKITEINDPKIKFYTYLTDDLLKKEKVYIQELSLTKQKLIDNLLDEVIDSLFRIDFEKLNDKLKIYYNKVEFKNKIFKKYIKYKYNYTLQENRNKYYDFFSLLTKKRSVTDIPKNGKFSFCFIMYNDDNKPGFDIKEFNITINNGEFYNNNSKIKENNILIHFLKDSIFFKNKFISDIKEFSETFNIKGKFISKDNKIFIPIEKFKDTFSKSIIKSKVDMF